jgi:hypothetical protein
MEKDLPAHLKKSFKDAKPKSDSEVSEGADGIKREGATSTLA